MSWGPRHTEFLCTPKINCYTTRVNQMPQNILKICGISPTAKTALKHLPASDTDVTISSLSQGLNGTAVVHPETKIYRCHQTSVFFAVDTPWKILQLYNWQGVIYMNYIYV